MSETGIGNAAGSTVRWLIRIPMVFAGFEKEILRELHGLQPRRLGRDFLWIHSTMPELIRNSEAAKFLRWNLPLHHAWPCRPLKTPGFVEKAAQALWRKFGGQHPQTILAGPLDSSSPGRQYHTLASNLRGRALQLFPPHAGKIRDAESQQADAPTVFCLVGSDGLFCGMHSPRDANGFHPGGTRFIRQNWPGTISRAGAKIAEALHHLAMHHSPPPAGSHWLELGASPGGMTSELLAKGYRVTAVDRAPLDTRLDGAAGLLQLRADAGSFTPPRNVCYDAILSDMNGDARESIARVCRLSGWLRPGGLVVFTLKLPGADGFAEINRLASSVQETAAAAGLVRIALSHLTYNRHEFTLFLQRTA
jgi:23S rRNA (cytidine2498-2'-O)-methyltransferase